MLCSQSWQIFREGLTEPLYIFNTYSYLDIIDYLAPSYYVQATFGLSRAYLVNVKFLFISENKYMVSYDIYDRRKQIISKRVGNKKEVTLYHKYITTIRFDHGVDVV